MTLTDEEIRVKVAERRVVCAALRRTDDGAIVCGPRHFDHVMRSQINAREIVGWATAEQGFVDQYGKFLSRNEAFLVALVAKQFNGPLKDRSQAILYSEHLY